MNIKKIGAAVLSAAMVISAMNFRPAERVYPSVNTSASDISELPADFKYAADWIWTNRIEREQSTVRRNTIFDQIVAGKGTINYVVKWQSYNTVTYEQRQQFEKMLSDCINAWNDWLAGYENWPYEHIDVKVVGWAVIDRNCLLDLHDDEIVYTDTKYYDAQYDTTNGRDTIPDKEPYAPSELSRFDHFAEPGYQYPGGLDKRFDMYMWATQGFPDIGGCGGDWGQRLSDTAYFGMIQNGSLHVLEHEIGHGFGLTDFYGGEGESDGFPPGGFPGGENSIMMAGSAAKITTFDGWMLRYVWTKIKDDAGRFDLVNAQPETTTTTTSTTTETVTETTTTTAQPVENISTAEFTDTIENIYLSDNGGRVSFSQNGAYSFTGSEYYHNDDSMNLSYYETGDRISIKFTYNTDSGQIISIERLDLEHNSHKVRGDVNADGVFDVADLVALSGWLIKNPAAQLNDSEAGDLCEDGRIDIYDIIVMRQMLTSTQ